MFGVLLLENSRLTVDGALPRNYAIARREVPDAVISRIVARACKDRKRGSILFFTAWSRTE